eukprot:13843798-Alexandrium_andersonii.AAC.1
MLTCQQLSQTSRQRDEEEFFTVGFEINLNRLGKALFNGTATVFNRLYVDQSLAVYDQPVQVNKVTSCVKVRTKYVRCVLSNLRQHGYFADFQLMDADNQKGLWEHSSSMNKNKKYLPNFKVAQADVLDDTQPEET